MKKDNLHSKVDELLSDLLVFQGTPTSDPVAFSLAAVKAQTTQAILTGLQVQATLRLADATDGAVKALERIADNLETSASSSEDFGLALEGIRKAITANG